MMAIWIFSPRDRHFQFVQMLDGDAGHRFAHDLGVNIKDPANGKTPVAEAAIVGQRMPQVAGTDNGDAPLPVQLQDLAELLDQIIDLIAGALLAKFTKVGEVFADLRRTDAQVAAQFMRGSRQLLPFFSKIGQGT